MFKVMTVFGTRPEAIKMAPLINELKKYKDIQTIVVVTAQHREMLDQVLELFSISPDYDLNIMKENQTLSEITARVVNGLDNIIKKEKPQLILVHGDTTTTFVSSLVGFYNQIPIGHVEAGLRTNNKFSPFPEEMNRQLTGCLVDLHFAPTNRAKSNLLKENKPLDTIFVTGNTAIDALKTTVSSDFQNDLLNQIASKKNKMILLTTHRRENLGEPMQNIFMAIKQIVDTHKDIEVVFPVHMNPYIKELSSALLSDVERIHLIPPLDVLSFHNFIARAHIILTDSGGIQEEAPSLGKPVLVLRETTERSEGVDAGTLKLVGWDQIHIVEETRHLLTNQKAYNQMSRASNPFGDGDASVKIVEVIRKRFFLD
ncbi:MULTISPECIES: non-hydrolyzing UDP-N-acetylglucosamine 2-epimerase [unclassified Exiguobacterium]|uniref:non-hydrolyzing UDP-N-acetylglucosamine 2-epimerase n=1 Tax=unclassified Exiguobacterium TaxID=2644629 RepID=UPI001BE779C8|nr:MULTISPECIES: UDP-N-acetylglucosamine 2-epimerase (non-hydrolyzing) [unclassified Exiguobacterium]